MDNKQAQFILESYRPNDRDSNDPQFNEALNQVARDPALAIWFAEERALDAVISQKLKKWPVPAELRDDLLANRPRNPSQRWQRHYAPLGLAAAVAFLAIATALWFKPAHGAAHFTDFRNEMLANVSRVVTLSFVHEDLGEIQKWLATQATVTGYQIPDGLQRLPGRGCRTLTWNGHPVVLICFRREGNETVHLFVAPRGAMPDPPPDESAQFARQGRWATASWSKGEKVYVMASLGDPELLRPYL